MKFSKMYFVALFAFFSFNLFQQAYCEESPQKSDSFLKTGVPGGLAVQAGGTAAQYPRFTELVKAISPAVVNISVEAATEEDDAEAPAQMPAPRHESDSPFKSLGSGFIVQEDGYIVTNNHVIDKASRIIVRMLNDKTEYDAQVVGKDIKTDLALLKISSSAKLPVAFLGNSDDLEVGEWVVAIGNQFQLGHTVSAGIVSALARKVRSPNGSPYDAYIQTDASINPGSSGGPLVNTKGQVIGINTAIFSPGRSQFGGTGFNIGIGFAIPINLVKGIVEQLKERGKVVRGLLGVIIQPIDNDMQSALSLKSSDGALVADVMDGTPASIAGFERKDVIVSFDGKKIRDYDDLPLLVADTPIGKTVRIEVIRNGEVKALSTTISELKDQPAPREEKGKKADSLGLVVEEVTAEIAQAVGRRTLTGVAILGVEPGSLASRAGLERGDVLEELAGRPVMDMSSYAQIRDSMDMSKPALALIRKKEGTRFLVLKPRAK